MKIGKTWAIGGFAIATALATGLSVAHPGHEDAESYAKTGPVLSYFSTPNRHHTEIKADAETSIAKVSIELKKPSDVLIQFTSGLATVTADGCPCSARVSVKVDDREPVVVKRVNLGTAVTMVDGKYQPDRQSADGSFALNLPAGRHEISLVAQRVEGRAAILHAFYPNLQVQAFPNAN